MSANNKFLKGNDVLSARRAKCFMEIEGRRYNFASIINLEATVEKEKAEVPRLGATIKAHKTVGQIGTFSGTMHFNQSVFRQLMYKYKETAIDPYFRIILTNEDEETIVGAQTVILEQCSLDNVLLSSMDADGEYIEEPVEGTFDDWYIAESFKELPGF